MADKRTGVIVGLITLIACVAVLRAGRSEHLVVTGSSDSGVDDLRVARGEAQNVFPQHPAPARNDAVLAGLWFGLFGGFLGLTLQTLVDYAVASSSCFTGRFPSHVDPHGSAWWVLVGATLAATALAAGSIAVAYLTWHSVRGEGQTADGAHGELLDIGEGRTRFMAMAGMVTSAILLATIIFHGAAVLTSAFCRSIG